ncbi:MAG: TetR/AcrR family transcriptional regulator [Candidatus Bipolaricaulota bacterium]
MPTCREEKRDQIHRAALRVFAQRGFHDTTVADIAQEAGIAKGTVYLYYESKDEILIDVFRRYTDAMLDAVDKLLDSALPVPEVLEAFVALQIDLFRKEPDLVQVLSRRSLQALSDGDERMRSFHRYLLDRIARLLDRGTLLNEVRAFDPRVGACVLLAMQETLPLYMSVYGAEASSDTLARVTRELAQFMWCSLRKENPC